MRSDTGWMMSSSSHSLTVGAATSTAGSYGSWSQSGTTSATNDVTFTWAESIAYRDYRQQHRYGKYRWYCGGPGGYYTNNWLEQELYGTGGFTNSGSANPGFTNYVVTVAKGTWARSSSSGHHTSLSGGVLFGGVLGINLSLDTNYDSNRILYYRLVANGRIYGDNAVPSLASRVRTAR